LDPLEKYLRELRSIRRSGSGVAETFYYPALRDLMDEIGVSLKPRVKCIIHVSHSAGIPDGGLFTPRSVPKRAATVPQSPPKGENFLKQLIGMPVRRSM
jgi:hypothetical protein